MADNRAEYQDPAGSLTHGLCIVNRYKIEKLVASGGMGFVYLAQDIEQERYVALKVMRSSLQRDPVAVERFKREVRTVKRLMHPNTIELSDYGITDQGYMFLVMEWLKGKDLREILRIKKRLSPITAARIAIQAAWSLSEAHSKSIVHRDLKPENIFVLHNPGPQLRVKVVDFGLAKAIHNIEDGDLITRGGVVCGTPEYMSPEQAKGEELDGRCDIYALGCVLYAMLVGAPPFRAEKALQVAIMHVDKPFPKLPEHVPRALADIIYKSVAKKPGARYQRVEEVAEALQNFLEPFERRALQGDEERWGEMNKHNTDRGNGASKENSSTSKSVNLNINSGIPTISIDSKFLKTHPKKSLLKRCLSLFGVAH